MRARHVGIIVAMAGGLAALGLATSPPPCTPLSGTDRVSVPLSRLARGAAGFFSYRDAEGERIRFILARDEDGKIHCAFDACRQCYRFHEGYTVSGNEVICRHCGRRYNIAQLEKGEESCVPVALADKQHDGVIQVQVADLKRGKALF